MRKKTLYSQDLVRSMMNECDFIVEPMTKPSEYDLRGIINYCKAKNISSAEITDEELKQFLLDKGEYNDSTGNN